MTDFKLRLDVIKKAISNAQTELEEARMDLNYLIKRLELENE